jgi:hypothetical protein
MSGDTFIHETTRTCDNAAYQIKPGDGPVLVAPIFDPRGVSLPRWLVYRPRGDHRLVLGMYTTETAAIAAAREIEREGTP